MMDCTLPHFTARARLRAAFAARSAFLTAPLLWCLSSSPAFSQGGIILLETGAGGPLISAQVSLASGGVPIQRLSFVFGFTTDEAEVPGEFLDSITASISDASSANYLPLVTVDAALAFWAPGGGTIAISESEIARDEIAYPAGVPSLATRRAWRVGVDVPDAFQGMPLLLFFDLFDNANATRSAAWLDEIFVEAVPEPAVAAFLALGMLGLVLRKRRAAV